MGGIVTAVTLAFSPFTSYTKEKDGHIQPKDCLDFRILDTLAEFYNITVRVQNKTRYALKQQFCVLQVEVKEPADGQWGRQMENGSWTGVVPI